MASHWSNWARTAHATPIRVETPASGDELAAAVRRAASAGERVRAVGAGLSFNAIAVAPEVQVDTRGLRGLRHIDRAAGTATFGAGTRVAEAAALLEAEGLALQNPSSNTGVTLAGSMATGSQGSSLRSPSASTQLVGATLVTGSGEVMRVSERAHPELWPALQLSLGALGIMSDVTVRTAPAHRISIVESKEPLRRVLAHLEERVSRADHCTVRWLPHTGSVIVRTAVREPGAVLDEPEPGAVSTGLRRVRDGLRVGLAKSLPALVPTLNRVTAALQRNRTDLAGPVSGLTAKPPVPYAAMSYAFPLDRVADMVRELQQVIERGSFHVPSRVLLSFAPADHVYLSTAYGRPTGSIHLAMPSAIDPRPFFLAAEERFLAGGGLPHWSSYHTVRAAEFAHVMPRFHDFLAVRDRLDPDRRFENAYLRRVLGR